MHSLTFNQLARTSNICALYTNSITQVTFGLYTSVKSCLSFHLLSVLLLIQDNSAPAYSTTCMI